MKTKFYFIFSITILSFFSTFAQLQNHQVIVVSGGSFSNANEQVRIGSYKPFNKKYYQFDSIDGNFTNVALVDNGKLYVNAKDILYKYDLDTYKRELQATIPGVSGAAIHGNKIVVARNYGTSDNYVQILNKTNLSFIASIPQVSDECNSVVIVADTAYVSVPGNWMSTVGKIAMINLVDNTFIGEIDLGTNGAGIGSLFVKGNTIYSVNTENKVITKFNTLNRSYIHNTLATANLSGAAGVWGDTLYASLEGSTWSAENIGTLSLSSFTAINSNKITGNFSNSVLDTISAKLFCAKTDFSSYGDFLVYNTNGNRLDSVRVGVSPDAFGLDFRPNAVLDFDLSKTNALDTDVITISSTSTSPILTYSWIITPAVEFVEGTSATSASPKIKAFAGNYSVKLTGNFVAGQDIEQKNNFLKVSSTLSVNDAELNLASIYPNPATNYLTIDKFTGTATIVNLQGQKVCLIDVQEQTKIDVSNLNTGVYFVHLTTTKSKIVLKFVKQ